MSRVPNRFVSLTTKNRKLKERLVVASKEATTITINVGGEEFKGVVVRTELNTLICEFNEFEQVDECECENLGSECHTCEGEE